MEVANKIKQTEPNSPVPATGIRREALTLSVSSDVIESREIFLNPMNLVRRGRKPKRGGGNACDQCDRWDQCDAPPKCNDAVVWPQDAELKRVLQHLGAPRAPKALLP